MQRAYRSRNSNRREPVVEDLREKLNRKKQEKALNVEVGTKNLPPPDPAYNFLKDPLRGDSCVKLVIEKKVANKDQNIKHEAKCESKSNDAEQKNVSKPIDKNPRQDRNAHFDKKSGAQRETWKIYTPPLEQQPRKLTDKTVPHYSIKQQSVNNIKIVLSNESGERKCTIDEAVLVQIPVIGRKEYTVKPKSGKWPEKGAQKHYSDKNKQKQQGENKGKNEEGSAKQLELVNKNKNQSITHIKSCEKAENIANNSTDKSVISKKTPQIIANHIKPDQINEKEQKPAETLKENIIQSTTNEGGSKEIQE